MSLDTQEEPDEPSIEEECRYWKAKAGSLQMYADVAKRVIDRLLAAKVDCEPQLDLELRMANLISDRDQAESYVDAIENLIGEGDRLEIWVEDGGVILSLNGKQLCEPEETIRAALRSACPEGEANE